MDPATRSRWVQVNVALVGLGLGLVVMLSVLRRRAVRPLPISTPKPVEE